MAETKNIGEMANILSSDLFNTFRWKKCAPQDINWKCENLEHNKATHPADVVFYYNDPYTNTCTYIHTDLKSFSHNTLSNLDLNPVVESLSMQIECAEISEQWQSHFAGEDSDFNVHGLLFIYNHDNKHIKPLTSKYSKVLQANLNSPKNSRLYILDPNDIFWINNVHLHIEKLQFKKVISENYLFFYPQRKDQATIGNNKSATIDLLKSPFIIIEDDSKNIVIVYYRPSGDQIDEFVYLLDYLRNKSLIDEEKEIHIYQLDQNELAASNFKNAIRKYETLLQIKDPKFLDILESIKHQKITQFTTEFSELEIGMEIR